MFRFVLIAALASTAVGALGCAELTPPSASPAPVPGSFEPALVEPTVPAEDVRDHADTLVTRDRDALVQFIELQVVPGQLSEENRALLKAPVERGKARRLKISFARRRAWRSPYREAHRGGQRRHEEDEWACGRVGEGHAARGKGGGRLRDAG
jgi:hypothetical protein